MSDLVLLDAKVFLGEFDITGQVNAVSLELGTELQDSTTFASGGARERVAGLKTAALGVEGKVDAATIDKALFDDLGVADVPVSVIPVPTVGQVAYFFRAASGDYQLGGQVGELMRFSAGAENAAGKMVRGTLMINAAAVAATANGTALNLGATSAAQSLFAALHVFSASPGDTLDVIIQSDSVEAFTGTPETRITFGQIAGAVIGSEYAEDAGVNTDAWYRVSFTIAGDGAESFSFAVVLGIADT